MRDGWEQATLGDIATLHYGKPMRDVDRRAGGRVAVVGSSGRFGWHDAANVRTVSSIVVGRKGTAGSVTWFDDPVWVTDTAYWAEPKIEMELKFLHLALQVADLVSLTAQTGVPGLNRDRAYTVPIFLPSVSEQRCIVDLIGAVDDAIEAAEHLGHELSSLANSLLSQAELESNRQGWGSTTLMESLGGEEAIRTGPFGSQLHQSDYVSDGPVAVVMPANMKDQEVDMSSVSRIPAEEAERLSRHRVQVGDILWSRRGDVTRFAVIDSASESAICGTGCFLLRPGSSTISDWLSLWLATPVVRNWLIEKAVGATMANLNRTILAGIPVRTPSTARQTQFVEGWRALRDNQVATATQVSRLGYLRSNLLSVLLQGEHAIPESYDVLIGA